MGVIKLDENSYSEQGNPNVVVKEFAEVIEDDISDLAEGWTLQDAEELRPTKFPIEWWKYVEDAQKPLVKD